VIFKRRRRRPTVELEGAWAGDHAKDLFTYEMLLLREMEQDAMLWQTPTIALTAQAFLLTIALNPGSPFFATCLASALGMLVAVLSMQLMARHRFLNEMDRSHLHYLEERVGIDHISNREYFFVDGKYRVPGWLQGRRTPEAPDLLARQKSFRIWMFGMGMFAAVNFAIL
jgi:hypothetical protein